MSVAWVAVGVTVASGVYSHNEAQDAKGRANGIASQNAADLLATATRNNELNLQIADYNAAALKETGLANAVLIEENALRVADAMADQSVEEIRRHIRGEKQLAGEIRVQYGASGFQVNQGTPLHFLNTELNEAKNERDYMAETAKQTIFNYVETEKARAAESIRAANEAAEATLFNAGVQAEIYLNEQVGLAAQTQRSGANTAASIEAQSDAQTVAAINDVVTAVSSSGA